jgi:hypothetical protein
LEKKNCTIKLGATIPCSYIYPPPPSASYNRYSDGKNLRTDHDSTTFGGRREPAFSQPMVSTGACPDNLMLLIPLRTASQFSGAPAAHITTLAFLWVNGYEDP